MKSCYEFGYGNWELTFTETSPRHQTQPRTTHSGKFYFKGEYFADYVYGNTERLRLSDDAKVWAEFGGVSLSDRDARDFAEIERAADDLCQHLNEGCSMEDWCRRRGLEPTRRLMQVH
jgi:hypothetical protein